MLNTVFCSCVFPALISDWLEIFTKVTPVLIAAFIAFIAWRQWRTAQSKLRLDLYNRRFAVYENTLAFFQLMQGGEPAYHSDEFNKTHLAFIKSSRESQFLFDNNSGIFELLESYHSHTFKITALYKAPNPQVREQMLANHLTALLEFNDLIPLVEEKIAPYLNFHKI